MSWRNHGLLGLMALGVMTVALPVVRPGGTAPGTLSPQIRFHEGRSARRIPFTYEQMHIIVTVEVGGSLQVPMLLDTGLGFDGAIMLDPALGEQLGLKYTGEVPLGGGGAEDPVVARLSSGGTLALPGVTFTRKQLLVVTDAAPFRNYPARGIIGKTVFDCVVEIDYDACELHLYDGTAYRYEGPGTSFPVGFSHDIPVMDAAVHLDGGETVPVKLLVDTGAAELLLLTFSHPGLDLPGNVIRGSAGILSKGLNGIILGSTGRVTGLGLGGYLLEGVITSFPEQESWGAANQLGQNGMIGNDVLRRFLVVFDYPHRRIHLDPGPSFREPFDWDTSGLITELTPEGTLEVIDVVAASPAGERDINRGDVIVAVDGRPVRTLSYGEIWKIFTQDGARVTLTVVRSGVTTEKALVLRRLI